MGLTNNLGKLSNMITSTGSAVGINNSSPANLLHLAGASSTPSLRLGSTSLGYYWDIGRENASTGDFVFNNAQGGASSERMRITTGGNVGIGTSNYFDGSGYGSTARYLTILNSSASSQIEISTNSTTNDSLVGGFDFINAANAGTSGSGRYGVGYVRGWIANASGTGNTSGGYITFGTKADGGNQSERMRITSTGAVLVGTSTATGVSTGSRFQVTGTTAQLIVSNTTSSGHLAIYSTGVDAYITKNTGSGSLLFGLAPQDGATFTEQMRITSGGLVYVGATSMPNGQKFGITGSGVWDGATIGLQNTGSGGQTYTLFSTNSSFSQGAGNFLLYNAGSGVNCLIVYSNGNYAFGGSNVSDRRLKQDIEDLNFGLNEIMKISPKSYNLKSENNLSGNNTTTLKKNYGFIAQEMQDVLPEIVTGKETETEYLGLDYNSVLAVAVKAIQEQQSTIQQLEARIKTLENK